MKLNTLKALALFLALGVTDIHAAATKYWDINGATAGAGGSTPAGNWNTATANWTTDSTGSSAATTFATGDNAIFSAGTDASGSYIVTIPSALTAGSVTVEEGIVTLTTTGPLTTQTIVVNSPAALFTKAALALTVGAGGSCTLNGGTIGNSNTGSGGSFFGSSTANNNMGIVLATGGGHVSANGGAAIVTIYTGPISGTGPLTIDGNGTFRLTTTPATYSGATIINGRLQISTTANVLPFGTDMTINSGGTFDIQNNQGINSLSGAGTVAFTGGFTLTNGSAADTTFSGAVTGAGIMNKVGAGTLTIQTVEWANTGGVNINGGTIKYGNSSAGFATTCPVTIASGATLDMNSFNDTFGSLLGAGSVINNSGANGLHVGVNNTTTTFSGSIGGTGNLEKQGSGNFVLSGVNLFTGKTTVSGGTIQLSADTGLGTAPGSYVADQLTLNGGGLKLNVTAAGIVANRGITLGASGGTIDVTANQSPIIAAPITGSGKLTKITSGNMDLTASNSFTGGMLITGGGVRFRNDFAAGTGTITVTPASIVTLRNLSTPAVTTITNPIVLSANGGNDIDLTAASGATFTLGGNISGTGYLTRGRAASTTGNIVLAGDNSGWSGGLYWGRGPLALGHKNALGTGTLTCTNVVPGESNVLSATTPLTGALAVGNAVNLTGILIVSGANDLELSGPMTIGSGPNIITNKNSGAFAISGIISGAGQLAISGPGTTVFSGSSANTYLNNTVINGTLDVQKDGGLSTGTVSVNDGATLKLENGVNNTYIASSANLVLNGTAPTVNLAFTGSPNTIHSLSFNGGASFMAAGTWGAIGSGAQHTDSRFIGTGMLNVSTGPTSSTSLATSGSPAAYGAVTLTATVTGSQGTPTGSVNFFDGATLLGSSPLVAGVATFNASSLDVAGSPHSLTAVYPSSPSIDGSTSSAISQDITPTTVTATVLVASKIYDGHIPATITNRSLAGVVGADDVTLGASGFATFSNRHVGTGKTVTVTGLSLSGTTAGNYTLASSTVTTTADIIPVTLTVTGLSADNKAYDGNTSATLTGTPALAGIVESDVVNLDGTATGTFAAKSPGTGKVVNVAGLSISGSDSGDYLLGATTLTANITAPPALTVTGITANNKAFDGDTNATIVVTNALLVGVIGSDDVTLVTTNATGAFQDATVGDGKTVDISGLIIVGADAANYSLTQPTTTADIKNALTVTGITASDKVYDATTAATIDTTGATLVGVIGADDVTLDATNATGAFADKNVGAGKTVTISGLALVGADANKFMLTGTTTATASITAASLSVTGLSATSKTYDGTNTAAVTGSPALTGVLLSDVVTLIGSPSGTFADKNIGIANAVAVSGLSLGGADVGNYSLTPLVLSADITPVTLTVTGLSALNKTYDQGTNAGIGGTPALAGVIGAEDVSVAGTPSGAFADKNVGLAKPVAVSGLSLSGLDAGNYVLGVLILNADITPLVLTQTGITANNKVYDGTNTVTFGGTMTVPGILSGDSVTLSGTPSGFFDTKDVGIGKSVGFGGVFLTGPDAGNYDLQLQLLTANITPASLTVTGLSAANKVYDATTSATIIGTPALAGVIGADDVSVTNTATGAFPTKTVGTGKSVTVTGLTLAGGDAGNYSLTMPTLTADITPATLTVTGLAASNKVYDGTTSATITGTAGVAVVLGSDTVSATGTPSGTFADKNVAAAKNVTVTGLTLTGADAANYSLAPLTLTADITSLATSNALVSSINPSEPGSNVTFTATLAGTPPAADAPTGDVVFLSNGVAFSTNALAGGVASASTASLATGTNTISAEYAGDQNFLGSTNSLQQVVVSAVTCSAVNTLAGIADNNDGTFTLTFQGTPQAQYYVVTTTDISTPMAGWTVLAGSTNSVTNLSGAWSFTVTNASPQQFYRSAAVVPCE